MNVHSVVFFTLTVPLSTQDISQYLSILGGILDLPMDYDPTHGGGGEGGVEISRFIKSWIIG